MSASKRWDKQLDEWVYECPTVAESIVLQKAREQSIDCQVMAAAGRAMAQYTDEEIMIMPYRNAINRMITKALQHHVETDHRAQRGRRLTLNLGPIRITIRGRNR